MAAGSLASCVILLIGRELSWVPMQTVIAAALPDAGRYNRDNVTVTIGFEDGSVANLLYPANGDRAVARNISRYSAEAASPASTTSKLSIFPAMARPRHSKGGQTRAIAGK